MKQNPAIFRTELYLQYTFESVQNLHENLKDEVNTFCSCGPFPVISEQLL